MLRPSPQTGRTVVSAPTVGVGPIFDTPRGVALDPERNRALVVDSRGVFAVDLDSGDRSILANLLDESGSALGNPRGIKVDLAHRRAFVVDLSLDSVLLIDLETGEWVIHSRGAEVGGD